ncbi:MAG TPA: hypothetical protein VNF47_08860 [Streptosporangiaceae bacterium]|nr:hypothetical protein [Streptosporangiaceae bacterium]
MRLTIREVQVPRDLRAAHHHLARAAELAGAVLAATEEHVSGRHHAGEVERDAVLIVEHATAADELASDCGAGKPDVALGTEFLV